ncbi:MAG: sulfatase-like hydrolase/transferase [Planctomycetes bacterium]|nr:sulfatase-like hydrolase/transferase [Planctomycetota bacterium]
MNCIWITIDSFRQDHIHCYRPEGSVDDTGESIHVQTPSIDQLATESVLCTRMRSEALPTVPCRRNLFTGRYLYPWPDEAPHKGMYIHTPGWRPLPEEDETVAEYLGERGYVTGIVADVYHLMKPAQNFHRGFQSFNWVRGQEYDQWNSQPLPQGYIEQFLKPDSQIEERRLKVLTQYLKNQMYRETDEDFQAARTFRCAIEWLERNHAHENFYLYIDSFDPHEPFEAPQKFIDLYDPEWKGPKLIYGNIYQRNELTEEEHHHVRARYAAAVTMVDHWVGELLKTVDRLGLRENTAVILVSDHGKILGEFGHYGMPPQDTGNALNPVPCIIRDPKGQNAGKRFDGWLYNIDVVATMFSLMEVEKKPDVQGLDLWPAVTSDDESFRDHLVTGHGQMVAVWKGDWLYLLNSATNEAALYNIVEDIHRKNNVADQYPSERDDLAKKIEGAAARRS